MKSLFKPGLYAITPDRYPDAERLCAEVRLALEGGAAMVQFRDKSADVAWRRNVAHQLKSLCDQHQAPLIINDDATLAVEVGAAGVHLGKFDAPLEIARRQLGSGRMTGVSCYDDLSLGAQAARQGADYLAFGSVFPSGTKPEAVSCTLDVFAGARSFGLPLVAIGGITPENGRAVVEAGADSLAVIGAIFDAPDIRLAAESFSKIWAR